MIGSVPLPVLTPAKHESADLLATGVLQPSRFRSSFKTLASPGRDTSDRPPESLAERTTRSSAGWDCRILAMGKRTRWPARASRSFGPHYQSPSEGGRAGGATARGVLQQRDSSTPRRRIRMSVVVRADDRICRRAGDQLAIALATYEWSAGAGVARLLARGWLANPSRTRGDPSMQKRACRPAGHSEHARLSAVAGGLLRRRDGVGRREEPPRYESGFRAHGSNQRFHRLLGHAVARALTTAPSLAGLGPAAPRILIHHGWRRKRRPGRCRENHSGTWCVNWSAG